MCDWPVIVILSACYFANFMFCILHSKHMSIFVLGKKYCIALFLSYSASHKEKSLINPVLFVQLTAAVNASVYY